jgi:uncharacterized protein YgiM (DUF1202 family)
MADIQTIAVEHIRRVAMYAINQPGSAGSQLQNILNAIASPVIKVKVTAPWLNIRSGPGKEYPSIGAAKSGDIFQIVRQESYWGRIAGSAERWISLRFTTTL